MVFAIILLLMVQAYCDLSLPQYTSEMIDVGLQNKGIEHVLPEKAGKNTYLMAQQHMTEKERELWTSSFQKKGDIYVRKDLNKKQLKESDEKLMTPLAVTFAQERAKEAMAKEMKKGQPTEQGKAKESGAEMKEQFTSREQLEKAINKVGDQVAMSMAKAYTAMAEKEAGMDIDKGQMSYLYFKGGQLFLMSLLMFGSATLLAYFASKVSAGVGRDMRSAVFKNVMKYSGSEMDHFSTASLITRSTNDVQQIQIVTVVLLRVVLYAPIIAVGGIYKVINTGAGMGWVIALGVLAALGIVMMLMAVSMPKFKKMQILIDNVNLVSREILTGLFVIRAFGREKDAEKRFDKANKELRDNQLFTSRIMTFMMPLMMFVMYCLTIAITWVSAGKIDEGTLQVGTMTAFIIYAMLIVMAFLMMAAMSIMLPRAAASADRIDEVINSQASIQNPEEPVVPETKEGRIVFENVSFKYPDAPDYVLKDIDFEAEPGKTTAIIGSTGCGKSSLINLIPRFYDVSTGSIKVDGVDIRDMNLKELRDRIGFVPQQGILFSGTIESNMEFGKNNLTPEEIEKALDTAQALDFVEAKEGGIHSEISQGGDNVSGGQKQRLSIARALTRNPEILIFDDCLSALDMKTDSILRKALKERFNKTTRIIVAQRISTVMDAEQILVLEGGTVVGKGTHRELIKSCPVYRQIAESQLSPSELKMEEGVN